MVRHVPFRAGHYALAVQRPLQRRRARVAGKHRRDTHTDRRAAAFLEAPQGHVLVVLAQRDAIMLAQVLQLGRRAVTRQISGRGAEDAAVRRQRIGHQRGVAQLADVHHHVPVVAGQPRRTVGQRQAGRDARAALAELRDQAGDVALPETQRRHHAQMAGHHAPAARQLVGQVIDFIADLGGALRQQATFVGQGGATAGTVHQAHAQPLFQRVEPLRHGGRRHIQRARRLRQRTGRRQAQEETKIVGGDHAGAWGFRTELTDN